MNWSHSREAGELIDKIVNRAVSLGEKHGINHDRVTLSMDITACHCNGCPLRLADLLQADDFNFAHDVFGISRHINRKAGSLGDCFSPRFAAKQ
jgi:hypothetical protein